jgi:hypothetical protein
LQKVFGVKTQDGPAIRGDISNAVQPFIHLGHRGHIGHKDQVMNFPRLFAFLVDTANLTGEQKQGGAGTGRRNLPVHGLLNIRPQPVKPLFGLNQFVLEFREPARVGEIAGAHDGDPLFSCPKGEVLRVQVSGSGPGKPRVDMEIGYEFHVPMETPSRGWCQPRNGNRDGLTPENGPLGRLRPIKSIYCVFFS